MIKVRVEQPPNKYNDTWCQVLESNDPRIVSTRPIYIDFSFEGIVPQIDEIYTIDSFQCYKIISNTSTKEESSNG